MQDSEIPFAASEAALRIMVTRPREDDDPLAERLRATGAEVIVQPAIQITPPNDWRPVDDAIARWTEFHWLVFSSANGVRFFFDRMQAIRGILPTCHAPNDESKSPRTTPLIAAIGPGTADELARYGVHADLLPEQYRAEALADALAHEASGRRFLLIRASRGREVLAERLTAAGAAVEQVVAYSSTDVERPDPNVLEQLRAGRIDWITVTSSAIARSLANLFGEDLRLARLASISPVTSATLRELGFEPASEAAEYTIAGLIEAIVGAEGR